jgi:hypothetical protein
MPRKTPPRSAAGRGNGLRRARAGGASRSSGLARGGGGGTSVESAGRVSGAGARDLARGRARGRCVVGGEGRQWCLVRQRQPFFLDKVGRWGAVCCRRPCDSVRRSQRMGFPCSVDKDSLSTKHEHPRPRIAAHIRRRLTRRWRLARTPRNAGRGGGGGCLSVRGLGCYCCVGWLGHGCGKGDGSTREGRVIGTCTAPRHCDFVSAR